MSQGPSPTQHVRWLCPASEAGLQGMCALWGPRVVRDTGGLRSDVLRGRKWVGVNERAVGHCPLCGPAAPHGLG